jgi:polyribonucleotide nucleotidyltransferase
VSAIQAQAFAVLKGEQYASRWPNLDDLTLQLAWKSVESGVMRQLVLREGVRADGRSVTDIRPITSRAGVLPRTHGSSLFTRGETQVGRVCGHGFLWIRGCGDLGVSHCADLRAAMHHQQLTPHPQ